MVLFYGCTCNVHVSPCVSFEISQGQKAGMGGYAKDYAKIGIIKSEGVARLKQE